MPGRTPVSVAVVAPEGTVVVGDCGWVVTTYPETSGPGDDSQFTATLSPCTVATTLVGSPVAAHAEGVTTSEAAITPSTVSNDETSRQRFNILPPGPHA